MLEEGCFHCQRAVYLKFDLHAPVCLLKYESVIRLSATRASVGKFYPAAPLSVWGLITDTFQWPRWGPTVKSVQCSDRFIRQGSRGQVLTPFGIRLPFVVTEYEHARFWSWEVASLKATGHRLQAIESGGCYLWFDMPLITLPYAVICRMALNHIEGLLPR